MNFLVAAYAYADGALALDSSQPLKNAQLKTDTLILAYARALDLWGRSGKFDVVLPHACASGSADFAGARVSRDVCGFGDPRFRLSANLLGAPALDLKEFAGYRQDMIVGASVLVSAPLGRYEEDRLLNLGTNRWYVKPEVGVSKTLDSLTLELAAAATFFSDNEAFFGNTRKEQEPLYALQAHVVYAFRSGIWAAFNAAFLYGGRTTVDGARADDRQEYTRVGTTVAIPVDRHNSLKLSASTGAITRFGGDFDIVGVAWQIRWGAGL